MSDDERIMTTGLQAWNTQSQVVLTITPNGRVVPGAGMQMDDVAREFLAACDAYTTRLIAENARLRERVALLEGSLEQIRWRAEMFDRDRVKAGGLNVESDFTTISRAALANGEG